MLQVSIFRVQCYGMVLHLSPSTTLLRRATTSFGREVRDSAGPEGYNAYLPGCFRLGWPKALILFTKLGLRC